MIHHGKNIRESTKKSRLFVILSLILLIVSVHISRNLDINYDIYSLLPSYVSSVKALRELQKEFHLGEEAFLLLSFKDAKEYVPLLFLP